MEASWSQHCLFQGAHVHETSVCVEFGAPCVGPTFSAASACLKVLRVFHSFRCAGARNFRARGVGARRRSVPRCLLETSLRLGSLQPAKNSGVLPVHHESRRQGRFIMLWAIFPNLTRIRFKPANWCLSQPVAPCICIGSTE